MKRILSFFLVVCTFLSMVSFSVSAEGSGNTLTMGMRVDDGSGNLLPEYEAATLKYSVGTGSESFAENDITLNDLVSGDEVTITCEIKDQRYSLGYFVVNLNGETSYYYSSPIKLSVGHGNLSSAIYAVIQKRTDLYFVDLLVNGNGSIFNDAVIAKQCYRSDTQIGIIKNDYTGFFFIPDEGYEITSLMINDSSISDSDPCLTKMQVGWMYVIESLTQDLKIEVSYDKITKPIISLSESSLVMNYKSSKKLDSSITDSSNNAVSQKVWWVSSNPNVAVIDQNGTVTAKGAGTAIVYAFSDGCEPAECTVNVKYTWYQQLVRILFFGWFWY